MISTKKLTLVKQNVESDVVRNSSVNAFDRNVLLMIDELYLSKRVEASGGQVFGQTADSNVAATALCFMIKSLSSGYKDMVAMYPIKNLRAETQKACFDKVMVLLYEVGFNVIGISFDNAPANRKIFKEFLCGSALKESVVNPFTGGQIFVIFDPSHIVENMYINFLIKRVFKLPTMPPLIPNAITARFDNIAALHNHECQKPDKIAQCLTDTVLQPKIIEKINVKLALAVFRESTVNALKYFGFDDTASFVELFLKFWSIINVFSSTIGRGKRDNVRDPVKSPED